MKKLILTLFLASLYIGSAAAVSGEAEPMELNLTVDDEKYNFYSDSNTIGFPSVISGGEPANYKNASYREFASWEVGEKGIEKVRNKLRQELGNLEVVNSGSAPDSIEITYVMNNSLERGFTYQELVSVTPSKVDGEVSFPDDEVETSIPVEIRNGSGNDKTKPDFSVAKSSESFGSSSGENYNASFKIINVTQGELMGEQVRNVLVDSNSISFKGYIELGRPCSQINRTYEQKDSKLVLKVESYSTREPCVDVIAFKEYSFNLQSEKPVRLEVRHNGQEVRTLETPKKHRDEAGVVVEIINFFQQLL